MKQTFAILFLALVIVSCKSTNQNAQVVSARVSYMSNQARNSITINSMDYGNNDDEAVFNTKKLAFQNLFFRGIANSPFIDPLIGINEQQEYKEHKDYLSDFYQNRMESFILNSQETLEKIRGGQRKANITLTINVRALRKDLEDKQIIKKFGL